MAESTPNDRRTESDVHDENKLEEIVEEDGSSDWEDVIEVGQDDVIEFAEYCNALLQLVFGHPALNAADPPSSPGSLWAVASHIRETYVIYTIPLLPRDAQYKSPRIANQFVFDYTRREYPGYDQTEPLGVDYIRDPSNWPDLSTEDNQSRFRDGVMRLHTIASEIVGLDENPTTVTEHFDWETPIPIAEIARVILGDAPTLERLRASTLECIRAMESGETDEDDSNENEKDDADADMSWGYPKLVRK